MQAAPHYLIITIGTTGDVHPFLHIARGLQAMGRQVTFITHTYHAGLVRDAGVPFMGLGNDEEYLRLLANPDLWDPKKSFAALMAQYGERLQQIDAAIHAVATGPKVAICHPFAVPGAAISRARGTVQSVVAAYLAPSNLKTCYGPLTIGVTKVPDWLPVPWRRALWRFIERGWIDPVPLAQINAVRAPLGLAKVHAFLDHIARAPDLSVSLFPRWFAAPQPDWPQPFICGDFPLFDGPAQAAVSAELEHFLAAGDTPLVFTAGTGNLHAAHFFSHALRAVVGLRRRAVFLARDRGQVPAHLPSSVLWQPYAPFSSLLPRCAALVHHGGIGTTAEALRAGVPQLVVPFAWDQFDNGRRVRALGVGTVLEAQRLRTYPLTRRLRALTENPAIQARCGLWAQRLASPTDPATLCHAIEDALCHHAG